MQAHAFAASHAVAQLFAAFHASTMHHCAVFCGRVWNEGGRGKEVKRPQGYKAIYNEEKDAGLPGLGYWLNRAANRFAEYKPAELRSNPTATVKPGDKKYIGGSNPRKDKKSNFDIACDIIAGMKPETIKKLVANEYVNDAMREVLDKQYQKPLKG